MHAPWLLHDDLGAAARESDVGLWLHALQCSYAVCWLPVLHTAQGCQDQALIISAGCSPVFSPQASICGQADQARSHFKYQ